MIPNFIIYISKDGYELHDLLYTALKLKKIFSIRYGKIQTDYSIVYKPKIRWFVELLKMVVK